MKYVYVITWCINFLFANTDKTEQKTESNCDKKEIFIYKQDAYNRFIELKKDSSEFEGTIFYTEIRLDSVAIDSTISNDMIIKMIK